MLRVRVPSVTPSNPEISMTFQIRHFCQVLPIICGTIASGAQSLPVIPTVQHPVTNNYHGVAVADNYQWLEDASAPAVRDWMQQQNERTRVFFSRLPFREGIAQQ